ncbi:DUF547 domain-containing protein [Marinobacteraceae bacterium S3BR75-40.1]
MIRILLMTLLITASGPLWAAFDHSHAAWTALLQKHVVPVREGHGTRVDYRAFQQDEAALEAYLNQLSEVSQATFDSWNRDRRLAFLINAYNAFTVKLILTAYPDLDSIRDLGGFLSSPWDKRFFTLLGKERSLDEVEHGLIRPNFDEPRIHVAVNCASIGCPALRTEAYVGDRLDAQLEDALVTFLSDPQRNRYNRESGELEVSSIFDWYGDDFDSPALNLDGIEDLFARYAELLTDSPQGRAAIQDQSADIEFLDYNWKLNDLATYSGPTAQARVWQHRHKPVGWAEPAKPNMSRRNQVVGLPASAQPTATRAVVTQLRFDNPTTPPEHPTHNTTLALKE